MKFVLVAGAVLATLVCVSFADDAIDALQSMPQPQQPKVESTSSALNGVWLSNCFEFEADVYQVRTFEFVLDHLATITTISYPDVFCEQTPVDSSVVSATWDMGHVLMTEDGLNAYALEVLFKAGSKQELTAVKQIVHLQQGSFVLGINKTLDVYPQQLDWAITYSLIE